MSPQGTEWRHVPGIYSNEHALAWKKVVDAVHAEGSLIYAQLVRFLIYFFSCSCCCIPFSKANSDLPHVFQWHVGRAAHPGMPLQGGVPVSAPSPIAARGGVSLFQGFDRLWSTEQMSD